MKNPWLSKNPFMSMWLSGANKVASAARGQAAATIKRESASAVRQGTEVVKREAATAVRQGTAQWFDFWTGAFRPAATTAAPAPPATPKAPAKPAAKAGPAAKAARRKSAAGTGAARGRTPRKTTAKTR